MQHFDERSAGRNNPLLDDRRHTEERVIALAVLAAVLATTPDRYIYEFSLRGTPVGFVELELNGSEYRYTSIHVFNRGGEKAKTKREAKFTLTPALTTETEHVPASLALVRKLSRGAGCINVVDELTSETGTLCRARHGASAVSGQLLGKKFWIEFDGAEIPSRIVFENGQSSFTRVDRAVSVSPPDFTGEGFAVPAGKGALSVDPPSTLTSPKLEVSSRAKMDSIAAQVHGRPLPFCVDYVREFIELANAKGPVRAVAVHGLHVEDGRAYPHAWVRVQTTEGPVELDPTLDVPVTAATHLPLQYVLAASDQTRAGSIWLSLLSGERKLVRK